MVLILSVASCFLHPFPLLVVWGSGHPRMTSGSHRCTRPAAFFECQLPSLHLRLDHGAPCSACFLWAPSFQQDYGSLLLQKVWFEGKTLKLVSFCLISHTKNRKLPFGCLWNWKIVVSFCPFPWQRVASKHSEPEAQIFQVRPKARPVFRKEMIPARGPKEYWV